MIKVTMKGVEELQKFLDDLPRGSKIAAMRAATEYLIGNDQRGLKHEVKDKFVNRADAYPEAPKVPTRFSRDSDIFSMAPKGYFSWAQFHHVGMMTNWFTEKYTRTHEIRDSWKSSESDSNWTSVKITNDADGAKWVFGDKTQARQPARVGWRTVSAIIGTNIKGMLQAADRAVQTWIKAHEKQ